MLVSAHPTTPHRLATPTQSHTRTSHLYRSSTRRRSSLFSSNFSSLSSSSSRTKQRAEDRELHRSCSISRFLATLRREFGFGLCSCVILFCGVGAFALLSREDIWTVLGRLACYHSIPAISRCMYDQWNAYTNQCYTTKSSLMLIRIYVSSTSCSLMSLVCLLCLL